MFSPRFKPPKRSDGDLLDRKSVKEPMPAATKRRFTLTVVLTFVLLIVWYSCHALSEHWHDPVLSYVVMAVYCVAFAALLITYLVYNRAFVNKNVTEDMLPADWSPEKKHEFIEGNRRRAERSRWMVMLIIPFAVVFMVEAIYLFVWDGFLSSRFK